jgi:hypothetical protein
MKQWSFIMFFRILITCLVGLACPQDGLAQEAYDRRSSEHFGWVSFNFNDRFGVNSVCTVSGGDTAERLEFIRDFVPDPAEFLFGIVEDLALAEGEVMCGLRHHRGDEGAWRPARTEGFEMTIRAYKDGAQIGSDLSPAQACTTALPLNVNWTGFCFEDGREAELGGEEADYVAACIETRISGAEQPTSFIVAAGEVPDALSDVIADATANVMQTGCPDRTF